MRFAALAAGALGCSLLAGCAVGPKYQRPNYQAPAQWKSEKPWRTAVPKDSLPKGTWWTIFGDDTLNGYEQQVLASNQTLSAAQSRLEQARAAAYVASSALFPQVGFNPNLQRQRVSANRPSLGGTPPTTAVTQNVFNLPFAISYETDVFGRLHHNLEAANASYQASAADLQNAQLILTAELAADYFTLRELDSEIGVVRDSVAIEKKGLQLVENRERGGIASGLEVAQQKTVLDAARTQMSLLQQQRNQYEHAIAVLVGQSASTFSVAVRPLKAAVPVIPIGVPSDVLERRPDIAEAERMMEATNAQIGIAKAAFYPDILIGGAVGTQTRDIASLVSAPSSFWSLGVGALQTVFNGGRNRAQLAYAKAGYSAAVANYRQTILVAFQQVEDGLSGLSELQKAAQTQHQAVEDSQRALTIANNRYVGGMTNYLNVIQAQESLLANQRLASQILGQQMVASVYLAKALGGGWDASTLQNFQVKPTAKQAVQQ